MPYPKYSNNQPSRGSHQSQQRGAPLNPWDNGAAMMNNPMALVNNLVGALMQQNMVPQAGPMMGGRMSRDTDQRRRRSRSPPRRRPRTRSRSRGRMVRGRAVSPPAKRRRSPPPDRPDHEIYIGNYPANYSEAQLRSLFELHNIEVKQIRMKCDGHKVFAFAEAANADIVKKAIEFMDEKEIDGRIMRVRGSKDNDKKAKREDKREPARDRDRSNRDRSRDRPRARDRSREKKSSWIPKVEDSKLHLVNAFLQFLNREKEKADQPEELVSSLEAAIASLTAAYKLPQDDTLNVNRNIEDIFFRAVRLDLKAPEEANKKDKTQENGKVEVKAETSKEEKSEVKQNGKETEETKGGDECAANENTSESTAEDKCNPDNVTQEEDDVVIEEESEIKAAQVDDDVTPADQNADDVIEDPSDDLMGDEDILDDLENCLAEAENDVIETIEDKEEEIKEPEPVKKAVGTPSRGRGRRGGRK